MIKFQGVTKSYTNGIHSLDSVSFDISEGEFAFIIGPSGAGKTTALKMMIKEELPTEGNIIIGDYNITEMPWKFLPSLRRQIGVIFQDFKLLPTLTVAENIAFILEISGKSDEEINETVNYLLNIVNLSDRANLYPRQLSGGEQQRVAIARAIGNDPAIVLADEPTGNLDPENSKQVMDLLKQINDWGTTVVVSTHDPHFVNEYQSRVIALDRGKLIKDYVGGYLESLLYNVPKSKHESFFENFDEQEEQKWEYLVENNIEQLFFEREDQQRKSKEKSSGSQKNKKIKKKSK